MSCTSFAQAAPVDDREGGRQLLGHAGPLGGGGALPRGGRAGRGRHRQDRPRRPWPVTAEVRTRQGQVFTVPKGIPVIGSDRRAVGRLKTVEGATILVDRPHRRDVYIPFEFIADVTRKGIVLTIPAAQVDHMEWQHPSLI